MTTTADLADEQLVLIIYAIFTMFKCNIHLVSIMDATFVILNTKYILMVLILRVIFTLLNTTYIYYYIYIYVIVLPKKAHLVTPNHDFVYLFMTRGP